jgi:regulator of protease activity HflC (stomatin/prohibitin superfamily)
VDSRIKLIGGAVLGLVLILVLVSASRQIFSTNDAGYYQVKQAALSGTMSVHSEAGTFLRLFGNITTYQISDMHYFSKNDIDGGTNQEEGAIKIRFNDGGTAEVTGGIKFRLPSDPVKQLLIHNDFKSFDRLKHDLIRQTVAEALMQTATLMRAEESYSTRRAEFASLAEDQVKVGIYETETREFKEKDADGNEFVVREVNIKKNKDGQPIIRKDSALARYGVEVIQFVVKDIDFDPTIDALISKKKEAEQMKVVAKANAEKAKQDAITAREQGNAKIAVEKANQEVEKIKETTIAQKNLEVSQLQRQQAEQDSQAEIVKGKALAEVNRLKVQAGLTPLEKATIEKETRIGVAHELSSIQFPSTMILGGGGSNGSAMNPFDAVGLESFIRITDKLNKQNTNITGKASKDE